MGLLKRAIRMRELYQQGRLVLRQERVRLLRWQGELLLLAERRGVSVHELVGIGARQ